MEQFLKYVLYGFIGFIAFTAITIIDVMGLFIAVCLKTLRLIFALILSAIDSDNDIKAKFKEDTIKHNIAINKLYKKFIDLLYPTNKKES